MKKFVILTAFLLTVSPAFCEDLSQNTRCADLILQIRKSQSTIANVLNLTDDQKKCKETIDKKFHEKFEKSSDCDDELSIISEYDKEFQLILTRAQKSKLRSIRKMERSALKFCKSNKVLYKPNQDIKPFGMK